MLKNRLLALLITMTLGQAIKAAEPADQAMQECQNSGLLAILSEDMLNAQIAPYLSLQDIARVRRTCKYLSKHFWDHERVLEFDTSDLLHKFKVDSLVESLRVLSTQLVNRYNPVELNLGLDALDFSGNKFTELPAEIQQLTRLKKLNLRGNILDEQLVINVCNWFPQLHELNLSATGIRTLPVQMRNLKHLRTLVVCLLDRASTLLLDISQVAPYLHKLDVSADKLKQLPQELYHLRQLRHLKLSYNYLVPTALENLCGIPHLRTIDLSYNGLEDLPATMSRLQELRKINLMGNLLPSESIRPLCSIAHLRILDLYWNNLTYVPEEIKNLTELSELDISGNKLRSKEMRALKRMLPHTDITFV